MVIMKRFLVLSLIVALITISCEKDELKPDEVLSKEFIEQLVKSDLFVYHIMGGVDTLSKEKKELKGNPSEIKSVKRIKKSKDRNLFLFKYENTTDSIYIDNAINEFDTITYSTKVDQVEPEMSVMSLNMNYMLVDTVITEPNDSVIVDPVDTTIVEVDNVPPIITLNGEMNVTIVRNRTYVELGAVATDNKDGDISDQIKIEGEVNTSNDGSYYLYYSVKDKSGNYTEKTRTILVVKPEPHYTYETISELVSDTIIDQSYVDYDYPGLNGALMSIEDIPNESVWLAAVKYEDDKYSIFRYVFNTSGTDIWEMNATHNIHPTIDISYVNNDTYNVTSYNESNETEDWINDTLCNVITTIVTYETVTVTRYTDMVVNNVTYTQFDYVSRSTGNYENSDISSHEIVSIISLPTLPGKFEILSNSPDRNIMKVDLNYRTDRENRGDFGEVIFLKEDYVLNVMGDGVKTADEVLLPYILNSDLQTTYENFDYWQFYNSEK
jgi:hypothetical protein